MNRWTNIGLFSLTAFLLLNSKPAYAYIDPGTSSIVLQIVLGGIGGAWLFLKSLPGGLLTRLRLKFLSGKNSQK